MYNDEYLSHYGVPGMKWGVRKARGAYDRALDIKRRKDRRDYIADQVSTITKPGSPADTHRKLTQNRKDYQAKDAKTAWRQARNKAKIDPAYKDSEEYRAAQVANGKVVAEEVIRALMGSGKKIYN